MSVSFDTDNNVIVSALDKVINYARKNKYILLAQSVWWIFSVIGLQEGLVDYIDNLEN
jgi:hypothetical protein